jgi:hypothetical protein
LLLGLRAVAAHVTHAKSYPATTAVHPHHVMPEARARTVSLSTTLLAIATWGVCGVLALLIDAIWRLGARAMEAYQMALPTWALFAGAAWTLLMVYGEGYRVFQLKFGPRVVARALSLGPAPPWHLVVGAPLYCMSLIHAKPRGKAVAWITVVGVVTCVAILQQIPQPYRGLIDGGVAFALTWGAAAIIATFARALALRALPDVDRELPERPPP